MDFKGRIFICYSTSDYLIFLLSWLNNIVGLSQNLIIIGCYIYTFIAREIKWLLSSLYYWFFACFSSFKLNIYQHMINVDICWVLLDAFQWWIFMCKKFSIWDVLVQSPFTCVCEFFFFQKKYWHLLGPKFAFMGKAHLKSNNEPEVHQSNFACFKVRSKK